MSDDVEVTSGNPSAVGTDIAFECPMCGKPMVVGPEGADEIVMCPACDQEVIVPGGPLWDEVKAQMEAASQPPAAGAESETAETTGRAVGQDDSIVALRERLQTLENQLAENRTQCAATAESITQALNQATRYKVTLQRLEEKQRVLESMVRETETRLATLEALG